MKNNEYPCIRAMTHVDCEKTYVAITNIHISEQATLNVLSENIVGTLHLPRGCLAKN